MLRPMLARLAIACFVLATAAPAQAQPAPAEPPRPAWIGIGIEPGRLGVAVRHVWEPAAAAGLREGDEVMAVDGARVMLPNELADLVQQRAPGTRVRLELIRSGQPRTLHVTLEAKPTNSELVQMHLLDKPAPALEGESVERAASSKLLGHRGKVVVVAMFGSGCTACTAVYARLSALSKRDERGLTVLGAVPESTSSARALALRHSLPFGFLAIDKDTASRWVWFDPTAPVIAVIDRRGVVRYAGTIDEGLPAEAAERAAALEVDQAVFVAERLLSSARGGPR